jgi:cell division protein FtsB
LQVRRIADINWYRDDFGNLVGVKTVNSGIYCIKEFFSGLDEKKNLRFVTNLSLPSIYRLNPGHDIHAGGLFRLHKGRGNRAGDFHAICSAQDKYFAHSLNHRGLIDIACRITPKYYAYVTQDNKMARSKRRTSHKRELYYILCIVAVLVILLFSFLGPGGYRDLQKARLQVHAQRARVDRLERDNSLRMQKVDKLRTDPNALEKYAREKGYGREGEIIQQLPEEPKENNPPK